MYTDIHEDDVIDIEIIDLKNYYRRDVAKNKKLKFHYHLTKTDLFSDHIFASLSSMEKIVFIYFLYEFPRQDISQTIERVSSEGEVTTECLPSAIRVTIKRLHSAMGLQRKCVWSAIISLQQKQILTVQTVRNTATKESKVNESKVKKKVNSSTAKKRSIAVVNPPSNPKPEEEAKLVVAENPTSPVKKSEDKSKGTAVSRCIAKYCELWGMHYGGPENKSPTPTGSDRGGIKRLLKDFSEEKLKKLLEIYFAMPDSRNVWGHHSLKIFELKIKAIEGFSHTGRVITQTAVIEADKQVEVAQKSHENFAELDRLLEEDRIKAEKDGMTELERKKQEAKRMLAEKYRLPEA